MTPEEQAAADEAARLAAVAAGTGDEFLNRLENISRGVVAGGQAINATSGVIPAQVIPNAPANNGGVTFKMNGISASADGIDPLKKCFDRASKIHPNFAHFGANKAMDDPRGYLRETVVDVRTKDWKYKISDLELDALMSALLVQGRFDGKSEPAGKFIGEYAEESGAGNNFELGLSKGLDMSQFGAGSEAGMVRKALDSGSGNGGPLIRQDIEPIIYEAYLRQFPLFEQIRKFPANGLVHSYNQRTSVGTASTLSELGDLSGTDSQSTYSRKTSSNIAVIGTRRQISLKLQYAARQSGMSFDLSGSDNLEVMGALTAIARVVQGLICQGNFTVASKTLDDEEGLTDTNGFDGLRAILKPGATSITKDSGTSYLRTINRAVADVTNAGGNLQNLQILCSLYAKIDIEDELMNFLQIVNATPSGGFPTNLASNGIITVANTLSKLMPIPASTQAEGQGYYTLAGTVMEDIDVVDPGGIGLAYLGAPTPQVLELPVGFNNALSNVYIPFTMVGLVVFITSFHRKIRIPRVTS